MVAPARSQFDQDSPESIARAYRRLQAEASDARRLAAHWRRQDVPELWKPAEQQAERIERQLHIAATALEVGAYAAEQELKRAPVDTVASLLTAQTRRRAWPQ